MFRFGMLVFNTEQVNIYYESNNSKHRAKQSIPIVRPSAIFKLVRKKNDIQSSCKKFQSDIGFPESAVLLEDTTKTIKFLRDSGFIPNDSKKIVILWNAKFSCFA